MPVIFGDNTGWGAAFGPRAEKSRESFWEGWQASVDARQREALTRAANRFQRLAPCHSKQNATAVAQPWQLAAGIAPGLS